MVLGKLFGRKKVKEVSYEDSKLLAKDNNPKVRAKLASNPTARPEVLYFLAEDTNADVRKNVAGNSNTPHQANNILATDEDQEVRGELARKICRLLPSLSGEEAAQLREQTIEVLEILAQDQLPTIRAILSQSLKDSLDAPKHVIKSLAQDVEEIVAGPVLEFSPLLSEADLLEIIAGGVASGAMSSIARRANISEDISEAVAASLDVPAVAALLANKSAQVREETLDQIIDQAQGIEQLHEPLVMRVDLSIRAMRRIAGFVAVSLVDKLVEKNKLSKDVEKELKKQVRDRIGKKNTFSEEEEETGVDRAIAAHKVRKLNEDTITEAVANKDVEFIQAGLALMADIPVTTGKSILNSRNGKVVTALCWKAGLSMRLAMKIQQDIAHVPPRDIVNAKDGVAYPFDEKEMDWQLSFFTGG
ncbi:DUF2336 domain-containing protein [Sneathiella sp. P13V-1]|uniref:DUF2336 domain-containing protein n=1 Tax=Sneathiella sp. P13V-1 TaxID=2697366 RepID=UPI00187B8E62|nr:DUF2336 domain-containing protein [Sneathiella sp. P13V-1]MBE7635419.1 DUF2336 domain-containing protein [Sneathiella sp. P13V-1]